MGVTEPNGDGLGLLVGVAGGKPRAKTAARKWASWASHSTAPGVKAQPKQPGEFQPARLDVGPLREEHVLVNSFLLHIPFFIGNSCK